MRTTSDILRYKWLVATRSTNQNKFNAAFVQRSKTRACKALRCQFESGALLQNSCFYSVVVSTRSLYGRTSRLLGRLGSNPSRSTKNMIATECDLAVKEAEVIDDDHLLRDSVALRECARPRNSLMRVWSKQMGFWLPPRICRRETCYPLHYK